MKGLVYVKDVSYGWRFWRVIWAKADGKGRAVKVAPPLTDGVGRLVCRSSGLCQTSTDKTEQHGEVQAHMEMHLSSIFSLSRKDELEKKKKNQHDIDLEIPSLL